MKIVTRPYAEADRLRLQEAGVHPLLARLYAARRIGSTGELARDFAQLIPPDRLSHAGRAAQLLADAIAQQKKLLIIADYDADGATACAVGMRALRSFGARVEYLVPNRMELGYGLTPELVDIAAKLEPDLLITVDNGIASVEGVAHARRLGIGTLVTDHHLPGDPLPAAECIVNPNQPGCGFPSKAIAGVGVMFYVMLSLRSELRERGLFKDKKEPNLAALTDLVALGTVADVVPLDANNRILVAQGLKRLRSGTGKAGLAALARSGRSLPGFHWRDAVDPGAKRSPGLILRFGGHAQAAGLTIREPDLVRFQDLFERTAAELLPEAARLRVVETDGALESAYCSLEVAQMLEAQIWGQGFPPPLFCDTFTVENQRVVGERHLKLSLRKDGQRLEAIRFNSLDPMPARVRAAYRLSVNEFNGLKTVQLTLENHLPT